MSRDTPNKEKRFIGIICLVGCIVFLYAWIDTLLHTTGPLYHSSFGVIPVWVFAVVFLFLSECFFFIAYAIGVFKLPEKRKDN